jgi:tetratricopeptide (TPR) repeat protein
MITPSMQRVFELHSAPEPINFGDLPGEIDALLQRGVAAYRRDRPEADRLFREALGANPQLLPTYYCLYKIHTYQGNLDDALAFAEAGLREAARQAGWSSNYLDWAPSPLPADGPERFAMYTLKALAFIHLRRSEGQISRVILNELARLDPAGSVGWMVIADLAAQTAGPLPPAHPAAHQPIHTG